MTTKLLHAHFNGSTIQLDEDYPLQPDTRLLIAVLDSSDTGMVLDELSDTEDDLALWRRQSLAGLEMAYGDDEPDYSHAQLKERNPGYDPR